MGGSLTTRRALAITQVCVAVAVIISSIVNLVVLPQQRDLWVALLSAALGFLTPAPRYSVESSHGGTVLPGTP